MTRHLAPIGALSALLLGACGMRMTDYHDYRGDGTFTPVAGSLLCRAGYSVDLGSIDLSAPGEVTRRLEGLPAQEATIGVLLEGNGPGAARDASYLRHPSARIDLTLRDEHERIVLARHERLSEWTASARPDDPQHLYLYRRGTRIDVAVAPDAVRVERFPIGRDDSWGSYFVPRRGARYTLHFAVEEPDADPAGAQARLLVEGVAGCL